VIHDCIIGHEPGKVHPDMNPNYLVNEPWWIPSQKQTRITFSTTSTFDSSNTVSRY
jgi:hypothetical protein